MSHSFKPIVGIDLGTTNSAAAFIKKGNAEMIPLENGQPTMPSVVHNPAEGSVFAGERARNALVAMPQRTKAAVKREMGSKKRIKLGEDTFTPEETSAFILREIRSYVDDALGEGEKEAVITVPAYFTNEQRKATKLAGELAGFTVERIINEPTAAALAYGLHQMEADGHIVVYDLGGGTFDVSVVEMMDGILEVKASAGNHMLGGEDFDWLLVDLLSSQFKKLHGVTPKRDVRAKARLKEEAEKIKIQLSSEESVSVAIPVVMVQHDRPLGLETTVRREEFVKLIKKHLFETKQKLASVLNEASLEPSDIDTILLVGGSTRIPAVKEMITTFFGKEPLVGINPDEAVAKGAAVQAGIKSGALTSEGLIVTDVAPFSMGISIVSEDGVPGEFSPIITRNTTVPVSKKETFTTTYDDQDAVSIEIYQGEDKWVENNFYLNDFLLKGLPKAPAGREKVEVTLRYNLNGILEVTALNPTSKNEMRVTVNDGIDRHSKEAFEDSLAKIEAAYQTEPEDEQLLLFDDYDEDLQTEALTWIKRFGQIVDEPEFSKEKKRILVMMDKLERAMASEDEVLLEDTVDEAVDLGMELEI